MALLVVLAAAGCGDDPEPDELVAVPYPYEEALDAEPDGPPGPGAAHTNAPGQDAATSWTHPAGVRILPGVPAGADGGDGAAVRPEARLDDVARGAGRGDGIGDDGVGDDGVGGDDGSGDDEPGADGGTRAVDRPARAADAPVDPRAPSPAEVRAYLERRREPDGLDHDHLLIDLTGTDGPEIVRAAITADGRAVVEVGRVGADEEVLSRVAAGRADLLGSLRPAQLEGTEVLVLPMKLGTARGVAVWEVHGTTLQPPRGCPVSSPARLRSVTSGHVTVACPGHDVDGALVWQQDAFWSAPPDGPDGAPSQ